VLLGVPLALMFLYESLERLAAGRGLQAAWPGGQALVQSAIEVFDTAVRYLSNTVSFIRLAAFAIAHVAIGVVVFTLAALVNPVLGALIVLLGNAFVLGLEGLVVSVQALRLDYYEFFSKFYSDDGSPFRPFVLPGPPSPRYDAGRQER
jgi:V/A-type H+-transporting ATPase subunit I